MEGLSGWRQPEDKRAGMGVKAWTSLSQKEVNGGSDTGQQCLWQRQHHHATGRGGMDMWL